MTKSEFIKKINAEELEIYSRYHHAHHTQIKNAGHDALRIHPEPEVLAPGITYYYTPVIVPLTTSTPWTKIMADRIGDKLTSYRKLWKKQFSTWKRALPAAKRHRINFFNLCLEAGLDHGEYGSDHFEIVPLEIVWRKRDLEKYHATGKYIGLAMESRTRTYAKSCQWNSSSRTDIFLVGQNENGNAFCHQVTSSCRTIANAIDWIWGGAQVEERHGDIGITPCPLKHVEGENLDIALPDAPSHRVVGEIKQNGALYARNAFLVHEKSQHPYAYIGNEWKRIVVGRHSDKGMSSAD